MALFGPYYPPLLQVAMSHAERFASLLWNAEVRHLPTDARGRAWLVGRREELETFLGSVVEDWRLGRLSEDAAEAAVSAYLRTAHAGARGALELPDVPDCCLADLAMTVSAAEVADSVTVPVRPDPDAGGERTLVDPAAVLADLPPRSSR